MMSEEPEKTIAFFGEVFGWEFRKWDGPFDYWIDSPRCTVIVHSLASGGCAPPADPPGALTGGQVYPLPE